MKKELIYKDMFWTMEVMGTSFTVTYGKTGTAGKIWKQVYESEKLCEKEAKKYIGYKQGDGYKIKKDSSRKRLNALKSKSSQLHKAKQLVNNYDFKENIKRYDTEDGTYFNGVGTKSLSKLTSSILSKSLHYIISIEDTISNQQNIPIGTSKIKGLPHLPDGVDWPEEHYFLAQFNLTELSKYDIEKYLPNNGMLYIFFDGEDSCKIIFYDGPIDTLQVRDYPNTEFPNAKYYLAEFKNNSMSVSFIPEFIFYVGGDAYDFSDISSLIPQELQTELERILNCTMTDEDSDTRIFGRPIYWQGEDYEDEGEVDSPMRDNVLLFQDAFGDGTIHIWVDKEAILKKDFSDVEVTYSGT